MTIVLNGSSGITNDGGYTGDGVVFADTTPANTLVTTTGGNVGIGTSSPGARLQIDTPQSASVANLLTLRDGSAGVTFNLQTYGDPSFGTANRFNYDGAYLAFRRSGTEQGRFDSSGNLLVGTTTASGKFSVSSGTSFGGVWTAASNAGTYYYHSFVAGSTTTGTIVSTNGTTTSYNTSSDYRLKENIQPMQGALATVSQLKPCTYTWKSTGEQSQGFIAHELQEVVPDCVTGEKDAVDAEGKPVYQGIDTSFLVATLTAAIQELKAINDAQAETITALTARVAALDARLTSLEGTQNV